jgi:malate dehydrogenase (oxaloacetate-decarboxylating)(NADP+)
MARKDDLRGVDVLNDAGLNKSTGFSEAERDRLNLRGLLPAAVLPQPVQLDRVMTNLRRKPSDIERYIQLTSLQGRNERLFYRALVDYTEELLPLVYTPTVGEACSKFAAIFRQTRGFYVTPQDKGHIRENLNNWPADDVRVIVITDGERILGLGDLGANGMGIPIGKLALYVACAGIHPHQCLPVMLDVGTGNEELRNDPLYLGVNAPRISGDAYDALVEEFVLAARDRFPNAMIQFEDFLTPNAYRLLHAYRDRVPCFNDDIQGTAAVALAGVLASGALSGQSFAEQTVMFLGAGSAATGIADLMVLALEAKGLSNDEARHRLWFVDEHGLLTADRNDLAPHNLPYAHEHAPADFVAAIEDIRPQALIGATGMPGTFTEAAVRAMAASCARPAIFALSNPTSRAECTAEQAYAWSEGRCIYASGSPFAPVQWGDKTFRPGQGNNVYIFPGVGLGAVACGATRISEEMFLAAADALAAQVREKDLARGAIYPPLKDIRALSLAIAVAVAEVAYDQGLATVERPDDLEATIKTGMYDPYY